MLDFLYVLVAYIRIWKTLLRLNFILTSFITIVLKIPISSNCVVAPEIHIIKYKKIFCFCKLFSKRTDKRQIYP